MFATAHRQKKHCFPLIAAQTGSRCCRSPVRVLNVYQSSVPRIASRAASSAFLSDPFPAIGVCSVLLIAEFRHEWVRGGVRIFCRLRPQSAGFAVRRSARGGPGKGADHLLHCSANLSRVAFRSADDRPAGTAEDELVRACLHDVENHRHQSSCSRRCKCAARGTTRRRCRSGKARLKRNQRRSPSR